MFPSDQKDWTVGKEGLANMTEAKELSALILKLEDILGKIEAIAGRDDEQRKHDLVNLRRSLAETIGQLSGAGRGLATVMGDRSFDDGFRSRLNQMRHAVALHQSNFPATSIDGLSADYKASVQKMKTINREFIDWVKEQIRAINQRPE
jgi:hypothetical protein